MHESGGLHPSTSWTSVTLDTLDMWWAALCDSNVYAYFAYYIKYVYAYFAL